MKIALFALTGFGNSVLRALVRAGQTPVLVGTRTEVGAHPYFQERDITEEARSLGIPVRTDLPDAEWFNNQGINVLLTTTFHLVIPKSVLHSVPIALNLHPSLLPAYRGASPCYWVIKNGERETGLTLHELTSTLDGGRILNRLSVAIEPTDTQGTLRKKLANLSGDFVVKTLAALEKSEIAFFPQDEKQATSFPRFSLEKNQEIDADADPKEIGRHIRALSPWPGAKFRGRPVASYDEVKRLRQERSSQV